jgi:hypothetical protein
MAAPINGLSFFTLTFDKDGTMTGDDGLKAAVNAGSYDQLFFFSHGWNEGVDTAQSLYNGMFGLLAGMLGDELPRTAAVGVFWPSLLFPDDVKPAVNGQPPAQSTGAELATALTPAFPDQAANLQTMGNLLDTQPQDPGALQQFHALAAGLVTTKDPGGPEDSGMAAAQTADTAALFGHAATMSKAPVGNAQGLGNPFTTLWHGGREVLRTLSYYEMKNRAGVVGEQGLGPYIAGLTLANGAHPRINLMGHSFGARLAASTLAGLPDTMRGAASPVKSLVLVQGAFSHFVFSPSLPMAQSTAGALTKHRDQVDGPLVATHTLADRAVGWWYPTASMLSHSDAEAASDLTYQWGGMGHDGYQQDGVVSLPLGPQGTVYAFVPGTFYRLDSNAIIKNMDSAFAGAHSDIVHPEVAWAALSAAGASKS